MAAQLYGGRKKCYATRPLSEKKPSKKNPQISHCGQIKMYWPTVEIYSSIKKNKIIYLLKINQAVLA